MNHFLEVLIYSVSDNPRGQRSYRNVLTALHQSDGRVHIRDVYDDVLQQNIRLVPADFNSELYTIDSVASAVSGDALRENLPTSGTQLSDDTASVLTVDVLVGMSKRALRFIVKQTVVVDEPAQLTVRDALSVLMANAQSKTETNLPQKHPLPATGAKLLDNHIIDLLTSHKVRFKTKQDGRDILRYLGSETVFLMDRGLDTLVHAVPQIGHALARLGLAYSITGSGLQRIALKRNSLHYDIATAKVLFCLLYVELHC